MTPETRLQFALLGLSFAWLVTVWVRGFRVLAKDRFRSELFALRERLFDLAASGRISFDDPAYLTERKIINVFIRDTDRITFVWFALTMLASKRSEEAGIEPPPNQWRAAVAKLPRPVAFELLRIDEELFRLLFRRIWADSIIIKLLLPWLIARRSIETVAVMLRAFGDRRVSEGGDDGSCLVT